MFAERIDEIVGGVAGRRIALLGLAFKANTDDIRSSPAIELARWLIGHDAIVVGYDPAAGSRAARAVAGLVACDTAIDALAGAEACVIATEWPEFKDLDWSHVRGLLASPIVVDGRRLLDPGEMRDLGYRYERVGSPPSVAVGREPTVLGSQV
jgi:UDPglucose 6-dehydrogenase